MSWEDILKTPQKGRWQFYGIYSADEVDEVLQELKKEQPEYQWHKRKRETLRGYTNAPHANRIDRKGIYGEKTQIDYQIFRRKKK
jgi:muconolactone delta-isomerase